MSKNLATILLVLPLVGCGQSPNFNRYWYNNQAELTSYKLTQARYGELHRGEAVLVFVTEPFNTTAQVKEDNPKGKEEPVLKLNFHKQFTTGIYPYSMLNSCFMPVSNTKHAIKISSSTQEWCGHTFLQMNNHQQYELRSFSYFQSEGDQHIKLDKTWLEDELWAKLRLDPTSLPTGELSIIPAFFYLRLAHKAVKSYKAVATNENGTYTIHYPNIDRELRITYETGFPYLIKGWEETYVSGWGKNAKKLTTTATKMKTIKDAYWKHNHVKDSLLRKELQLSD